MKGEPLTEQQAIARSEAACAVADLADRVLDVARRDELRHIAATLAAQAQARRTEFDTPTYLRAFSAFERGWR